MSIDFLSIVGIICIVFGFVSGSYFISSGYQITGKLAEWIYLNQRQLWYDLGRPGTRSFKGEDDNGHFSRVSALNCMIRLMPLRQYEKKLLNGGNEYIVRYQKSLTKASLSMVFFFLGIFLQIWRS